jgi:hypothetical protein
MTSAAKVTDEQPHRRCGRHGSAAGIRRLVGLRGLQNWVAVMTTPEQKLQLAERNVQRAYEQREDCIFALVEAVARYEAAVEERACIKEALDAPE